MNNLSNYLNYGYTNRVSKYFAKFLPAQLIIFLFVIKDNHSEKQLKNKTTSINLPTFKWKNTLVEELKGVFTKYNFNTSITLSVFGSIATNEITNYSDFDGLLIYNEKEFNTTHTILSIKKLIEEINLTSYLQDSLQHHGIIVIGKQELIDRADELTNQLMEESHVIYGEREIAISLETTTPYQQLFSKLIKSIERKLDQEEQWQNQYFFKNMLSELLLLPCSYLQYKLQKYISKKESFEIIKNHLQHNELTIINQLEEIRTNWNQPSLSKSELSEKAVNEIKLKSTTPAAPIAILSAIKSDLLLLLSKIKPND